MHNEKNKRVLFVYLIILIIVIYLLVASISGIIKFWKIQGRDPYHQKIMKK